MKSFAGQQQNS